MEALEERKTIGERLLERMSRRARFEPRGLTGSNNAFDSLYDRFARTDIDSRLGSLLYPDSPSPKGFVGQSPSMDGLSYLSSAPYWDRVRRLGNARLRRQQRLASLQSRFTRFSSISAARRLPSLGTAGGLPFLGLAGLLGDDFAVLSPSMPQIQADEQTSVQGVNPDTKAPFIGAKKASSPGKIVSS